MKAINIFINTKFFQPCEILKIKEETNVINPSELEIKDLINTPPYYRRYNGLISSNIYTFSGKMIEEHFSSENSSKTFYRFSDKQKLPLEAKTKSKIIEFQDGNHDQIYNMHEEERSFFEDTNDNIEKNNIENENNDMEQSSKTECRFEKENGKIKEDKIEKMNFQNQTTEIKTGKDETNECQEEYEYQEYFVPVERFDLEDQEEKNKIEEEREFFSDFIRLFPSEKDEKINIMQIIPEIFLKEKNNNPYFKSEYCIKKVNDEYFITFSNWLCQKKLFTLKDIIICLFEMNVVLTWYYKVESYHINISYIREIYKENHLTEILFNNLCDSKETDNIIQNDILSKKNISELVEKAIKYSSYLKEKNKVIEEINDDFKINDISLKIINKLNAEIREKSSKNKSKIMVILEMLFLTFHSFRNGERFILSYIRDYIISYFNPFLKYISNQIINYSTITKENMKNIGDHFNYVGHIIHDNLKKLNPKHLFKLVKSGSFASGLCIEGSDMDLLICFKESKDSNFDEDLKKLFGDHLDNFSYIEDFGMVDSESSSKLIRLYFCFKDEIFIDTYKYIYTNNYSHFLNKEDLPLTKSVIVDITYTPKKTKYIKTNFIAEKIKEQLDENPHIIDITLFLKRLFFINDLNKVYYGGLSSYGLQSLIFQIKDTIPNNETMVAECLFLFLERYSKFDFFNYVVEKDGKKLRTRTEHPKTSENPLIYENMIAIDDPMDEGKNVIKGGYTPSKFFRGKPKNYICERIRTLLKKQIDLLKKYYSEFRTKNIKTNERLGFILDSFNVKIGDM